MEVYQSGLNISAFATIEENKLGMIDHETRQTEWKLEEIRNFFGKEAAKCSSVNIVKIWMRRGV